LISEDFCYCQLCGKANSETISRNRRLKLADMQKSHVLEKQRLAETEKENAVLKEKLQELEDIVKSNEDRHFRELNQQDSLAGASQVQSAEDYSQNELKQFDELEKGASGPKESQKMDEDIINE